VAKDLLDTDTIPAVRVVLHASREAITKSGIVESCLRAVVDKVDHWNNLRSELDSEIWEEKNEGKDQHHEVDGRLLGGCEATNHGSTNQRYGDACSSRNRKEISVAVRRY